VHRGAWIGQSSGLTSYEGIAAQLQAAVADPGVRGIALDIDSFGGEVAGVFDLADRIRAARTQKPVHAFVAEHALSAGYVLASQADRIILPRTGAVGSIGVVALHTDMSGALDQKGIAVTLIHSGAHKVDANPYQPLPEAVHDQMQRELEVVRFLFAETVAAGRGERLTQTAALATEAAVFRGADAIAAGLADDLADPVTAFHAFAAAPRGTTSPNRKSPQMTTTPEISDDATKPVATPAVSAAQEPPTAAADATPTTMTADAVRAEAAELAQVCAQAARLGVTIDAADAVSKGLKPEALRARVLADLAARSDAAGIVATAPAASAKESPIVAAAKKTATAAKR
jgi:ClpP class serine protease